MRILVVHNSVSPGSLEALYSRAFSKLGHDVVDFHVKTSFLRGKYNSATQYFRNINFQSLFTPRLSKAHFNSLINISADMIFIVKGSLFSKEQLKHLSSLYNASVLFYPDHPYCINSFKYIHEIMSGFDDFSVAYFFSGDISRLMKPILRCPVKTLPFAFSEEINQNCVSYAESRFDYDVFYPATRGPSPQMLVDSFSSPKLRYGVSGRGWPKPSKLSNYKIEKKYSHVLDFSKSLCAAKIIVNYVRPEHGAFHNMKTFEIAASGRVMITNRSSEQEVILGGNNFYVFDKFSDITDIALSVKSNLNQLSDMACRCRENILSSPNTYTDRAKKILYDLHKL